MAVQNTARRKPTAASEALGSRVRAFRSQRKWTLEQLAERAGMHVTYLSSIERGHRNPTLNVLVALAEAFSLSLSKLVDGIEERTQSERKRH